jgi:hypothetical protein
VTVYVEKGPIFIAHNAYAHVSEIMGQHRAFTAGDPQHDTMLAEVGALTSTVIPYVGSAIELGDLIVDKVDAIAKEFESREGMPLPQAISMSALFTIDVSPAATKFTDNIGKATAGSLLVSGLLNAGAVAAYDVAVNPNWTV